MVHIKFAPTVNSQQMSATPPNLLGERLLALHTETIKLFFKVNLKKETICLQLDEWGHFTSTPVVFDPTSHSPDPQKRMWQRVCALSGSHEIPWAFWQATHEIVPGQ